MILKIPHNIIRFFLALGIAFIGNNFLTPFVLSETLEEEKKEQLLDLNEKIIEKLNKKEDNFYPTIQDEFIKKDLEELIKKANEAEKSGLLKKSLVLNQEILTLEKNFYGEDHPEVATTLFNIGKLHFDLYEFKESRSFFLDALEIYKLDEKKQYEGVIDSLNELSKTHQIEGDFRTAISFKKKALDMAKIYYEPNDEYIGLFLNDLGLIYAEIGEYETAKELLFKSLEISKNNNGQRNIELSRTLSNLGWVFSLIGKFAESEKYYLDSLEIDEKNSEENKIFIGITKNNLGHLYLSQGLYKKAEKYYKEGLEIAIKYSGIDHPTVALSKNNLGQLYSDQERFKEAEELYLEAIKIFTAKHGANHPTVGVFKNNLAVNFVDQGFFDEAREIYEDSLKSMEEFFGSDHPQTSIVFNNLGYFYSEQNLFNDAEKYYLKSLNIDKKYYGDYHPNVFKSQVNLIYNFVDSGNLYKAIELAKNYYNNKLIFIQKEAPFLSLDDRELFKKKYGANNLPFSFVSSGEEIGSNLAVFYRLNNHGLLQEIEKRQTKLKNLSEKENLLLDKLSKLTKKLSARNLDNNEVINLREKKKNLEKNLYRLIPEIKPKIFGVEEIYKFLPKNSLLIEYKKYTPLFNNPNNEEKYIALIIKKNGDINSIDLGLAKKIDDQIKNAYSQSTSLPEFEFQFDNAQKAWHDLSDLIIAPLKEIIGEVETLFISPDSEINKVPFAALSLDKEDQIFSDLFNLRLLTTGRELISLSKKSDTSNRDSVVFANPNFNKFNNIGHSNIGEKNPLSISQRRSKDLNSAKWNQLPGTSIEGRAVAKLLDAELFEKDNATVIALENQKNNKIIHIATHAFYLENKGNEIENSMLRSGIVFSGANFPDANPLDDGYLMALEIARFNWENTDLVVISACESGRGEFLSGEGLYGLKRAINVAGAKSSLLSLWKVNDEATAFFMKSFYEKLIAGESRAEALFKTQREFRNHKNENYRHPHIWAAFQLSGDWRPIDF